MTDEQSIRYYYLYNDHGDVVRIVSGTNVTVKTYDYDAFGNDRNELAADANPFRYCGEYYDTATQTYFLRARWYDPSTGRFTQQDSWEYYKPDDPLGLNLYLYCYGNPIRYVDPSGKTSEEQIDDDPDLLDDELGDTKSGGKGYKSNVRPAGQGKIPGSRGSSHNKSPSSASAQTHTVKTKVSHMSNQEVNRIKDAMSSGKNIKFTSKAEALEFINKNLKNYKMELPHNSSAQGFRLEGAHINGGFPSPHINIYSKPQKISVHIYWDIKE